MSDQNLRFHHQALPPVAQRGTAGVGLGCWASVAALMLAMATPLAQAEWRHLATNPEGQFFYDDAVQREGDRVNVWRMTDFAKPLTNLEGKEVRSDKSRTTVDCANAKLANSQVTRYAEAKAQGEVMNHYDTPLRFTRIAPDSVDAVLMQKVCGN